MTNRPPDLVRQSVLSSLQEAGLSAALAEGILDVLAAAGYDALARPAPLQLTQRVDEDGVERRRTGPVAREALLAPTEGLPDRLFAGAGMRLADKATARRWEMHRACRVAARLADPR